MEGNSKKEFDESIKLTKTGFLLCGVELGKKRNCMKWLFYFNFIWLYTDVVGEFFWIVEGIKMGKTLDQLSMIAPCFTFCLLTTLKLLPFIYDKDIVETAVDKLRAIHPDIANENDEFDSNITSIERKIIMDTNKFLKSIITISLNGIIVVAFMFICEPSMLMAFEFYKTGDIVLKLPFLIKYFFDAYANKTVWSFAYIHQAWSTIIACANLFASDTFFYIFCTYLKMHFQILSHRFENVVSESPEETRQNLLKCVRRHRELIVLVNQLQRLYSKSTLFNIMSSSVLLCLSGFNITVIKKASAMMTFIPFLVMCAAQVYLMCFFGDMLMVSSIQISDSVYNCCWYDGDLATRKRIMIILIRSQKPCKLTAANFADLNLGTFTKILSRSWTCFALLKTMYE